MENNDNVRNYGQAWCHTHTHTNVIPALTWEAKAGESGAQDWPRLQRMDEHVYL